MKLDKLKVRCTRLLSEHSVVGPAHQNFTIGKVYDASDYDSEEFGGPSVYVTDDEGLASALFHGEFEIVTEDE